MPKGSVWDCVRLNDELDLLELRFELLDDVVDHFLVVEGDRTFTGHPKPSVLSAHEDRFARWTSKIIRSTAALPPTDGLSAWDLDNLQRRHLRSVLLDRVGPDDLLLIGDVDELPDPRLVPWLQTQVAQHPLQLLMEHSIFHANWRAQCTWDRGFSWDNGTMACRTTHFDAPMVRVLLGEPHADWDGFEQHQVPAAGCHLSYLGDRDAVRTKLADHSQQEWNTSSIRGGDHLDRCIRHRIHFQAWPLEVVPKDELHPICQHLLERRPDLFDFAPPPPLRDRQAYLAYTWLVNRGWLPRPVLRWVDRYPVIVVRWGRGVFRLADRLLAWKRARRLRTERYWKTPIDEPWPGAPPGERPAPSSLGPY